ncbi:PREDICTED: uncharacterized protein LOC104819991 [Tarenaya hassleriana]|uniref:uncharacterized protein LOC104819991 n=1 Tax=Tarenaya hassleriana TaxID=28532 RepID=UPI00053C0949|nr:PREDICTED: uncharacterized protein LOC104819991 [Tarenaya hassleriana]
MKKDFASAASREDPRMRFKHEILLEDYRELEKENEVRRRNLEMMKQIRSTLRAEVRFLRQRYKHLSRDRAHEFQPEKMRLPETGDLKIPSKVNTKRKKQTGKESRLDLNKNGIMYSGKEDTMAYSTGDSGKKQKRNRGNHGNEVSRTPMSLPDLNQSDRICNVDGNTSSSCKVPVFDLNEITREEEESQANGEQIGVEDRKNTMPDIGNDELQGEIKLAICRNLKKGLSRAGKRKVSWQDPVALRV